MADGWQARNGSRLYAYVENEDTQAKHYQAARAHYGTMVEQAPENISARNNLAWLFWNGGEAAVSQAHVDYTLGFAPDAASMKDTACMIHLALGDFNLASDLLGEEVAEPSDNPEGQFHYA